MTFTDNLAPKTGLAITLEMLRALPREPESGRPETEALPTAHRFPLRELAPDAAEYLAQQKRFSVREMKTILPLLPCADENDFKDAVKFYEGYLDKVEVLPAAACALDYHAIMGQSRTKARKINKKPCQALRLARNRGLANQVAEVFDKGAPMSTELIVAFFYDYAQNEIKRIRPLRDEDIVRTALRLLEADSDDADEEREHEGWDERDIEDDGAVRGRPANSSAESGEISLLLSQIVSLASGMSAKSKVDTFDQLVTLAHAAQDAKCLDGPLKTSSETIARVLRRDIDEVRAWLCQEPAVAESASVLSEIIEVLSDMAAGGAEVVANLKQCASDFHAAGNFAALAECSHRVTEAQELTDSLVEEGQEARAGLISAVAAPPNASELTQMATSVTERVRTLGASLENFKTQASMFTGSTSGMGSTDVEGDAGQGDDQEFNERQDEFDGHDVSQETVETVPVVSAASVHKAPIQTLSPVKEVRNAGLARKTKILGDPQGHAVPMAGPDEYEFGEKSPTNQTKPADETPALDTVASAPILHVDPQLGQRPDVQENRVTRATISETDLFGDFIFAGAISVAEDVARSIEATGGKAPLSSVALQAASVSRVLAFEYTPTLDQLSSAASEAMINPSEGDAMLLFGALLPGAVLIPDAQLRQPFGNLGLGNFGTHLNELQTAVSSLSYNFPPDQEELAALAGSQTKSREEQLRQYLETWIAENGQRSGPCQPSTKFLHGTAKPTGGVGRVVAAISCGAREARAFAKQAIESYGTHDALESSIRTEVAYHGAHAGTRLNRASTDYLRRRFSEVIGLLHAWLAATSSTSRRRQGAEAANAADTVNALRSRLQKAAVALTTYAAEDLESDSGHLRKSLVDWVQRRINTTLAGISGEDPSAFTSVDEAAAADADRLMPEARQALQESHGTDLLLHFQEKGFPNEEIVLAYSREAGAFSTASHLARSLRNNGKEAPLEAEILVEQNAFVTDLLAQIKTLSLRLTTLRKLDLKRQERYPSISHWCEANLETLHEMVESGEVATPLENLDVLRARAEEIDRLLVEAEDDVRNDQLMRAERLQDIVDAEDARELSVQIRNGLAIEAAENRIALLRDGRSIGHFEDVGDGPMAEFSPSFVEAASADEWPATLALYSQAFSSSDGPLATKPDRRNNATELMSAHFEFKNELEKSEPSARAIQTYLEALGVLDVRLGKAKRVQGSKMRAWSFELQARIEADGWFLPQIFGSESNGRYRLVVADDSALPEQFQQALAPEEPAFVLIGGRLELARRLEFAARFRGARLPVVLIDETLIAFTAVRRTARLETVFSCGLPYGRVEPYVTNAGALPPEMFFGRDEEIQKIISRDYEGCLVFGGRQLGKSALLNHIRRTIHSPDEGRIVVLGQVTNLGLRDDPASNIWRRLHTLLSAHPGIVTQESHRDADELVAEIRLWLGQNHKRRILALFDETDEFISAESASGFPEIAKLKELMENTSRSFKVVFAGLHNVQRLHNVVNSPLPHFQDPIVIGPLNRTHEDKRAARDLVIEPMRAAGFRFESPTAVEEILTYTNEYPSLVQEFLKGLLQQLHRTKGKTYRVGADGPLWTIPTAELFGHDRFSEIEDKIRGKFRLTLDLDVRYALVAYTMAHLALSGREQSVLIDGLSVRETLGEAELFWPKSLDALDAEGFGVILDEMYDLGILGRIPIVDTKQHRYCLRSPQVVSMLGGLDDVGEELLKILDREPKARYDKATYLRGVSTEEEGGDRVYLPLTDHQIERLLDREYPGPRIICGLRMLGLGRVGRLLERVGSESGLPGVEAGANVNTLSTDSIGEFRKAISRSLSANEGLRLIVHSNRNNEVDPKSLLEFAESQPQVRDLKVRPLLLLDAAVPDFRDLAIRRKEDSVFLKAWGTDALRMHLRQVEANELDSPKLRNDVLRVTGGVPEKVIECIRLLRKEAHPEEAFDRVSKQLRPLDIPKLPEHLVQVLKELSENAGQTGSLSEYTLLDELIKETNGCDLETAAPDLIAMGLLRLWKPEGGLIAISALGVLFAKQ